MRAGYTVSIVAHAAILGYAFLALPHARPFSTEAIEAFPVDLVSIADATDLAQGAKNAEKPPEDKPQPKPQVAAEVPAEKPADKPAETPVEAARPPAPRPPPPAPEPEPQPEPEQVAALREPAEPPPPEPEPEPLPAAEPVPEKPVESRVPRARPTPPKPVAQPTPPKPTPAKLEPEEQDRLRDLAQAPEPEQEFNTEDIAALLDKRDPAGGGDPEPSPEPQTIGSIDGRADAAMTQSEIQALKARLYQCWNPPVGVREAGGLQVMVRINLLQDGSLSGAPEVTSIGSASDPLAQIAAESAVRAVVQCAPFGDILRPEKYSLWSQIDFLFDPSQLIGG
jgi:hypothetical protein